MATVIKLPPEPSSGSQPRETPKNSAGRQGLGSIELTPPIITATIVAVVLVLGALFFLARPGALGGGASAQMMDTGTETTLPGHAEKHANGMDSSTESPGPAAIHNGMDTSTGQ